MAPTRAIGALLAALGCLASGGPETSGHQTGRRLDGLDEARVGDRLPPGWEERSVGDGGAPTPRVVPGPDGPVLRLEAHSAAGQVAREVDPPLPPRGGVLSWSWRVTARPDGTELRDPDRDDAAARLFVVFGGGGLFGRPRFVFYTWGNDEEVGDTFLSHVGDRVAVVVVRTGSDPTGAWLTERRDPAADFRRAFGREPDGIRAVGLMADTDQLGGRAVVELRSLRWDARDP